MSCPFRFEDKWINISGFKEKIKIGKVKLELMVMLAIGLPRDFKQLRLE